MIPKRQQYRDSRTENGVEVPETISVVCVANRRHRVISFEYRRIAIHRANTIRRLFSDFFVHNS